MLGKVIEHASVEKGNQYKNQQHSEYTVKTLAGIFHVNCVHPRRPERQSISNADEPLNVKNSINSSQSEYPD